MIHVEGSYCARENEKLNCVVLITMIEIHLYAVSHHLILYIRSFIFGLGFGLDLKKLASASALTSKPHDPGLGLEILASFNITGIHCCASVTQCVTAVYLLCVEEES